MAGTTPVSTLRELPYQFHSDTDEDTAPSGRTYKTDDLHFINDNLELLLLEPPFNLLSFRTGTRRKWKLQATKDYIFTTRKTKFYWVSHLQVLWHGVWPVSSGQWLVDPLGYGHMSKTGYVSTSQHV